MGRFRSAWQVREEEIGSIEKLYGGELEKVKKLGERLTALEKFMNQKKEEFTAYGKKVQTKFAEKEKQEKQLLETKADLEKQLANQNKLAEAAKQKYAAEIERAKQAIERGKQAQEKLKERAESEVARLKERFGEKERALADAKEATSRDFETNLEKSKAQWSEEARAFQEQIAVRDDAIGKLKGALVEIKTAYAGLQEQLAGKDQELANKDQELANKEQELANREAELADAQGAVDVNRDQRAAYVLKAGQGLTLASGLVGELQGNMQQLFDFLGADEDMRIANEDLIGRLSKALQIIQQLLDGIE